MQHMLLLVLQNAFARVETSFLKVRILPGEHASAAARASSLKNRFSPSATTGITASFLGPMLQHVPGEDKA